MRTILNTIKIDILKEWLHDNYNDENIKRNGFFILRKSAFSILFFLLYFIADGITGSVILDDSVYKLYDLTFPLVTALLVLSRQKALPVILIMLVYSGCMQSLSQNINLMSQVFAAIISNILYFKLTGKRGSVSFGRSSLTLQRIVCLVCFNSLLNALIHSWLVSKLQHPMVGLAPVMSVQTLIKTQWIMTSCITGVPFCYLLLRAGSDFSWGALYLKEIKKTISNGPGFTIKTLWCAILVGIIYCLTSAGNDSLFFSDYSILWLLPVMLWGAIYIGHAVISSLWVIVLILLAHYVGNYICINHFSNKHEYVTHVAYSSSLIFISSLTIITVGVLSAQVRHSIHHLTRMSLSESNTGLPNVGALKNDIKRYSTGGLCLMQCPELNTLTQIYGINIRFQYVKALALFIKSFVQKNEGVYYTPGYGILLRLNTVNKNVIDSYFQALTSFRFTGDDMEVGLALGFSYLPYSHGDMDLPFIIGSLNACALVSLRTGEPEAFLPKASSGNEINSGSIRHFLQQSIDRKSFILVIQPIVSTSCKPTYYEVLIRMKVFNNQIFFPDTFLPLAHDAGLLADLDMVVIEQTFRVINSHINQLYGSRFSINITPQSLVKLNFMARLKKLFTLYAIPPEQIVFEIIESDIIDSDTVMKNLQHIREFGCKIAIDDFGTGASSYSRLKSLEADILKIDGSFIHNIVNDKFDRHTVSSFCEAAKLKNMEIVAEFVETKEIKEILIEMGVDWLQGYYTGKPLPIEQVNFSS